MTTEIKEFVSKCEVCMMYRSQKSKEPIVKHELAERPWGKVGADLCELPGCTLLIVTDYYSNFVEVKQIHRANTHGVTKALKPLFARYGAPDVLFSDNGPQFGLYEF